MDEELQDVRQIHMAHTTVRGLPENRIDSGAFDAANVAQFDWNSFMSSVLNFSVDPLRDDPHDFPVGETSVISGLLPAAAAAVAAAAATAGGTDLASELQLDKQITMSVLHSTQQTKKQSRFQTLFGFDSESTESESDAVSASAALANNNNNNLNMNNNHNSNNNHAAHTQTNNTFSFLGESSWPSSNIVFPFL